MQSNNTDEQREADSKAVKEYCSTIFTDETGNDEALIYNMRAMAFFAGIKYGRSTASPWLRYPENKPSESGNYWVVRFEGDWGASLWYDAERVGWNLGPTPDERENEIIPLAWMHPIPFTLPEPSEGER